MPKMIGRFKKIPFLLFFFAFPDNLFAEQAHDFGAHHDPTLTCTASLLEEGLRCSDYVMMDNLSIETGDWFLVDDFERLDKEYYKLCQGTDRFPDGSWHLLYFTYGLYNHFSQTRKPQIVLSQIQAWQKFNPKSMAALYAEAIYWRARSWAMTSHKKHPSTEKGVVSGTPRQMALNIIESIGESKFDCPAWHALLIDILVDMHADEKIIRETYKRSAEKYPEYHDIHFSMARKYAPDMGGTPEAYQEFAVEAARLTASFEGMGMYARIFWQQDFTGGIPFSNNPLSPPYWEQLRKGYDDLIKRYPLSMNLSGKYADIACRAGDKKLYHQFRKRIDGAEWLAPMFYSVDVCDLRHGWESR